MYIDGIAYVSTQPRHYLYAVTRFNVRTQFIAVSVQLVLIESVYLPNLVYNRC